VLLSLGDTFAGGLLVPEGITPVVSASITGVIILLVDNTDIGPVIVVVDDTLED
jgi:hypothetical protein